MGEHVFNNEDGTGWYFWDIAQENPYGPYDTEETAREEFRRYCMAVLG